MRMHTRSLLLVALLAVVHAQRAWAQNAGDQQRSEQRIRDLEARLAVVESQLEQLLRERNAAPPALAEVPAPRAITPATATPAPTHFEMPPDLIPEVGKIGAEIGVLASASANPFRLDQGAFYGGYADFPLIDKPAWLHGKIAYELMVGLSRSETKVTSTSNVAQVVNLAVLTALSPTTGPQNLTDSLTGTGTAPFPVTTSDRLQLRLLQVVPLSFKYTSTALDRWRLRPYALLGFGTYVTLHSENPLPSSSGVRADANLSPAIIQAVQQAFGGTAPFGSPLIAGQISQSRELGNLGLPSGTGGVEIGLQTGGGVELRLTRTLSLGFDARYNKISGTNGNFGTYGSRIGIHF